ncbi:MAG: flap endonuclease [Actinobacteria bacterium]|nr:flap endonuclease [Actinomycetota bacterium]
MRVHLIDGTYELFRYFFAVPSHQTADGREVGAIRGVLGSMLGLLEDGATHVAVATDHVIESFRNNMWDGYKDGSEMDPFILEQFHPLEAALESMGLVVWPMVEFEADDGMGAGAKMAATDDRVEQVLICTPDKDLGQCVGGKVVQFDRRKGVIYDVAGVREKFGVPPEAIPDYLGLVGDTADGFPGLKGWGAKSAATVLDRYGRLEDIPLDSGTWDIKVRSAAKLAATLAENIDLAMLFRRIATIETDAPVSASVDDLEWRGPRDDFAEHVNLIDAPRLADRAARLADRRFG